MSPRPAQSSDTAATLRHLKLLVALLVLSNLGLGIAGFYLLERVDRRYSELVDTSLPLLNDLRELTSAILHAQHAAGSAFASAPAELRTEARRNAEAALEREGKIAAGLEVDERLPAFAPTLRRSLQQAGATHRAAITELIPLLAAGRSDEANRRREKIVRPAFEHYIDTVDRVAKAVVAQGTRANSAYTDTTTNLARAIMVFGSWPVLLLAALLLLTAIFVVAMMIAFRGKDLADMP